jgi:hypothetical protein
MAEVLPSAMDSIMVAQGKSALLLFLFFPSSINLNRVKSMGFLSSLIRGGEYLQTRRDEVSLVRKHQRMMLF